MYQTLKNIPLVAACQPDSLAAQRRCHISLVMIATWFPGGTELVPTIAHHGCRLHLRLHREDPNYRSPFMPHYSQSAHGVVPVTARHECHFISRRCTATTKHRLPRLPPASEAAQRLCDFCSPPLPTNAKQLCCKTIVGGPPYDIQCCMYT